LPIVGENVAMPGRIMLVGLCLMALSGCRAKLGEACVDNESCDPELLCATDKICRTVEAALELQEPSETLFPVKKNTMKAATIKKLAEGKWICKSSIAKDEVHHTYRADGSFDTWSRSKAIDDGLWEGGLVGKWATQDGELCLRLDEEKNIPMNDIARGFEKKYGPIESEVKPGTAFCQRILHLDAKSMRTDTVIAELGTSTCRRAPPKEAPKAPK
jgi:hypothetical protein